MLPSTRLRAPLQHHQRPGGLVGAHGNLVFHSPLASSSSGRRRRIQRKLRVPSLGLLLVDEHRREPQAPARRSSRLRPSWLSSGLISAALPTGEDRGSRPPEGRVRGCSTRTPRRRRSDVASRAADRHRRGPSRLIAQGLTLALQVLVSARCRLVGHRARLTGGLHDDDTVGVGQDRRLEDVAWPHRPTCRSCQRAPRGCPHAVARVSSATATHRAPATPPVSNTSWYTTSGRSSRRSPALEPRLSAPG